MCLYLYSEDLDCPLEIPFMSESISLTYFGSSEVFIDMLIKNPSANREIHSLCIIYPNAFIKEITSKHKIKKTGKVLEQDKTYGNLSTTLTHSNHNINLAYSVSGYKREIRDRSILVLEKPKPSNLDEPIIHDGIIPLDGERDRFGLFENLTDTSWIILKSICMSIFRYSFATPMKCGEKRWVRLFFNPRKVATYYSGMTKSILLWSIDDLIFTYAIMGPLDVVHQFRERLAIQRSIAENKGKAYPEQKDELDAQLRGIEEITTKVVNRINQTKIGDFTLHIFPRRIRTLISVYAYGKIQPNGILPNFLPEDERLKSKSSWSRRVYDWSATGISNPVTDNFSIFFSGKSHNRFFKIIVLITILIVVISAVSSFISDIVQSIKAGAFKDIHVFFAWLHDFALKDYPLITYIIGFGVLVGFFKLVFYVPLRKLLKLIRDEFFLL